MPGLWGLLLAFVLCPTVLLAQTAVKLTWDPPEPSTGLVGYILEQKVQDDTWGEIARPTAPPYTDTISIARQPICWRVRGYSSLGKSDPSNELCLQVPSAPSNLRRAPQASSSQAQRRSQKK